MDCSDVFVPCASFYCCMSLFLQGYGSAVMWMQHMWCNRFGEILRSCARASLSKYSGYVWNDRAFATKFSQWRENFRFFTWYRELKYQHRLMIFHKPMLIRFMVVGIVYLSEIGF